MENPGEIKIRALPRTNEGQAEKKSEPKKAQDTPPQKRWIIYVGVTAVLLGVFTFFYPNHKTAKMAAVKSPAAKNAAQGSTDLASTSTRINENVSRHMQDAEIQSQMMKRKTEMENASLKKSIREMRDDADESMPDDHRSYGVQLDGDQAVDQMLEDINPDANRFADTGPTSPADKINARIANRKWMNEMERAEKVQFISNFIRSAYDRGYEVEIDANLVVVGVKKINHNKVLDINQVIDRLAKGQ